MLKAIPAAAVLSKKPKLDLGFQDLVIYLKDRSGERCLRRVIKKRNMKKYLVVFFAGIMAVFNAMAQEQLVVDPNAQLREIRSSFSKIKVSHGIDIFISQADTESLAVSASEQKYADKVITVVEGNTLRIYYDGGQNWSSNNKKLKVYISFKNIDEIDASGASDVHVAGTINAKDLKLKLSGSSDFTGNVKADQLIMDLSGSSDVKISGTAALLNLENSGASDVKGYELAVDICNSKSSGASDVNITVNKELNVVASGASDVYYKGNPVVKNVHSSGASTVARSE